MPHRVERAPVRGADRCGSFQAAVDDGAVLDLNSLQIVGGDRDDAEVAARLDRGRLAEAQKSSDDGGGRSWCLPVRFLPSK